MTELSVRTNYFWQMAILGRFMAGSCPPYLMEENFSVLRERVGRIEIVYGWLDECLDRLDAASVDGINLRDTLDWMGDRQQDGAWRRVERAASSRACVVLRSAARGSRLPHRDSFSFDEEKELSNELTFADRSATHGRVLAARRVALTPRQDVPVVLSGRGGT